MPYPTYPQFPICMPHPYPQPTIPQYQQQQPLQSSTSQTPPRSTQLPAQPVANLNNRASLPAYNVDLQTFPTYLVTLVPIQEIQLRSRKVLNQQDPIVIIEEESEEKETPSQITYDNLTENTIVSATQIPSIPYLEQPRVSNTPPYSKRLK